MTIEKTAAVSVIVPNYNHARYLRKRVESILAQTYQDFELILLDDCSTDESREILRSYASDRRVRIDFNEKNSGTPFKQWNKGVRLARGKYVWMAESDDYADARLLERLVANLEKEPRAAFAYCRSWEIGEDGERKGFADAYLDRWDAQHWKADFLVDGMEECRRYFVVAAPVPNASAVVFRKDAYQGAGNADENLRLCGDYKLWASMAMKGKIAYTSEPLNYYRSHRENARTRAEATGVDLAEYFRVMRWIVNRVAPAGTVRNRIEADSGSDEPTSDMSPLERTQSSLEAMAFIANWNLRHNPHVPKKEVRARFEEWRLALYEKEFALSAPSRWRYFLYKCDFYGYYFPEMSWRARASNLLRLVGASALGYRGRHRPRSAMEHVTRFLGGLRQKY